MEIRKPKKSKGVPKQYKTGTLLQEVKETFSLAYGAKYVEKLNRLIEKSGYWDASLSGQIVILSNLLFESVDDLKILLDLLKNSNSDYLRGSAAFVVYLLYSDNPKKCCLELKSVGKLDGISPQEEAQVMLSNLAIKHGVKSIHSMTGSWINDSNERVRRLLVEAFRPRGVWKQHIKELKVDPTILKPLLQKAIGDKSLYVRKAAANNLNDISKENPEVVISWTQMWNRNSTEEEKWSIKHGLRGLLRDNNKEALSILGFDTSGEFIIKWTASISKTININTLIPLEFKVKNNGTLDLKLRLHLRFLSPGKGRKQRTKDFVIATFTIPAEETKIVTKNFHFVDYNSTPRLPGKQTMILFCNGEEITKKSFYYPG